MAEHRWGQEDGDKLPSIERKAHMKCLRCVKNEIPWSVYREELFPFIGTIDEVSKWEQNKVGKAKNNSTLGFGSYKNPRKNTLKNIASTEKCVEYIEVNNDWEPEYFITFQSDIQQKFQAFMETLKKIKAVGDPPAGVTLGRQKSRVKSDRFIFRKRDGRDLFHSISWTAKNREIDDYIERLKGQFPDLAIQMGKDCEFVLL